ncbi:hypothetical protein KJ707_00260 [Patescibacteria group bacterium]|nr:hypothetical protein [Patescibacteria group bacterium]
MKDELKKTSYRPFPKVIRKRPANNREWIELAKRVQKSIKNQEAYLEKEEKQQNNYYSGRSILQFS